MEATSMNRWERAPIVKQDTVIGGAPRRLQACYQYPWAMSPTWIWLQVAIIVFVLIGMVVAVIRLA
jgi:hypothetical protein